jgi:rSAM/selenodomain-associated transferase 2
MRLSVIIPTLNEGANVARAIRSAAEAEEILVVDGGSVDQTMDAARDAGARVVVSQRGRGRQLAHGAAIATGDVLLFLHADTALPAGFRADVADVLAAAEWGRFDLRFDEGGPLLRFIAVLISLRSRVSRVATGDQAIFVKRDLFDIAGGIREPELFEDIDLCRRLRRHGRMGVPARPAVTSARRWRSAGTWRTTFLMWTLKLAYLCGVPAERLHRYYRDVR